MFSSIKTSKKNKEIVQELTRKLNLGSENIIARIAFAYSISREEHFDIKDIQDSQGKEYTSKILFGEYLPFYIAMICVHYNLHKSDKDIARYVKMHVDDGLDIIYGEFGRTNLTGMEYILQRIETGLQALS